MAGFKEVRLGILIPYDTQSGVAYKTKVVENPNGTESRVGLWSKGRKKWIIKKELLKRSHVAELNIFFRTMKGKLNGFRMRDWHEYKQTDAPMLVLTNTTGQMIFQYIETVTNSIETQYVTKPVLAANVNTDVNSLFYAPDITLKRDGVDWPSSGNWTLNRSTGIITYNASQAGHTITWSGSFDWAVRFDTDEALFHRESLDIHDWDNIPILELKQ